MCHTQCIHVWWICFDNQRVFSSLLQQMSPGGGHAAHHSMLSIALHDGCIVQALDPRGLSLPFFWVKRHPISHPSIHSQTEHVYWSVKAQQPISYQHIKIKEEDKNKYLRQHFCGELKIISQLEQCQILKKLVFIIHVYTFSFIHGTGETVYVA